MKRGKTLGTDTPAIKLDRQAPPTKVGSGPLLPQAMAPENARFVLRVARLKAVPPFPRTTTALAARSIVTRHRQQHALLVHK